MPSSFDLPDQAPIADKAGRVTLAWMQVFTRWRLVSAAAQQSGATASRPTTQLYVGRVYFDTTLNKPVWVKTVSPIVWVDAAGAVV